MLGIFLDTETNGLDFKKHKILEIAYKMVDLQTGTIKEKYHSVISQPEEVWKQSDLRSLKINGFTWDLLSTGKSEKIVREEILHSFQHNSIKKTNSFFICQNPSFDRPFFSQLIDPTTQELLNWPYHWLDLASMYWALAMQKAKMEKTPFPWEIGLTKDNIASSYNIQSEARPHRALNGVDHLLLCYRATVGFPFSENF